MTATPSCGEHSFDHGFLTGQIPISSIARWRAPRGGISGGRAEQQQSTSRVARTLLARQLFAVDRQLNTTLLILQNPDAVNHELAANKIRIALSTLDAAIKDLIAAEPGPEHDALM